MSPSLLVPGQPQVDVNTVALYHFDYPTGILALDATGNYTGTLYGNAFITTTGLYAGVLVLDGNGSYVRTGNLGNLSQGTLEAFVQFPPCFDSLGNAIANGYFTIISAGGEFGGQPAVLELGVSGGLYFGIYANGVWHWVDAGINPCRYLAGLDNTVNFGIWNLPVLWPYETWRFHHIAATWGPRGMEVWVDGVLHGIGVDDPSKYNNYPFPYMCNPQMQEASALYPINRACDTPVPAPTMPSYPPGDYTGGLPPYSTFLIGCNSSALNLFAQYTACFKGRIDEVRISNVQRQFQWTVVPTVTPTPTPTPVQITGAYAVTDNTMGLYHLDYTAPPCCYLYNEVSRQYDGVLQGSAVLVPSGRFGAGVYLSGGLDVNGNGPHISILPGIGAPSAGTVEAWIKLNGLTWGYDTILSAVYVQNVVSGMTRLGVDGYDGYLQFGVLDDVGSWRYAVSTVKISSLIGSWHHVAGTWGPRGLEIWIDGVLQATNPYPGPPGLVNAYWAGCDGAMHCIIGTIDEIRVSNVQRTYSPIVLSMPASTPTPTLTPTVTPSIYWVNLPFVIR